jgi:uncharacterized protein (DUF849 family)
MLLQACLNGARTRAEHPAVPLTPDELAREAAAAVAAGARSLHVHVRDAAGAESLAPADVAAAVRALRAAVARIELSLSTGLWITGEDVAARAAAVRGWTERPELVSLNVGEEGWVELGALLGERAIGIEAGLSAPAHAAELAASGLAATWSGRGSTRGHRPVRRLLVEVEDQEPDAAVAAAAAIDAAIDAARLPAPRLHHGFGPATWAVLRAAVARGREIRVGLEDVLALPDGRPAPGNAALVTAAAELA